MSVQMYEGFVADLSGDPEDFVTLLIQETTGEVIGYIKDVVEEAIWSGWTAATAPDTIRGAVTALTVCRILPRRDSPMAPGERTMMQQRCMEVREWLMNVHDGILELEVDMVVGEEEGWQAAVFGAERKATF